MNDSENAPARGPGSLDKPAARRLAREIWAEFLGDSSRIGALLDLLGRLLARFAADHPAGKLVAYMPAGGEVDHRPVWRDFAGPVYLPVLDEAGQGMSFRLFQEGGRERVGLREGRFGLMEPADGIPLSGPLGPEDLVLVPGLAADPAGRRLGRGGGFYDRRGSILAEADLIALLPESLARLEFRSEMHDLRLNRVVTERGLVDY